MQKIEKFSPNLNKLPYMLLYGMCIINMITGLQLYSVEQYTSAWFLIPLIALIALFLATVKWYVFNEDQLVEKGFFSTKKIPFTEIRNISWENDNSILAIEYTDDPDRVTGDFIRVLDSRVINFERFLAVLSERVGFYGKNNRDYKTEKKHLKTIKILGVLLFLILCVVIHMAFSREFYHFNNTLPSLYLYIALGVLVLPLIISIFLLKKPFSEELEAIGFLCIFVLYSGIFCYFVYQNIQNEKAVSQIEYHDFKLEWSGKSYQNWKSLSLQMKNDNNQFKLTHHWNGFNPALEDGKTYKIPVHIGKNNDYMFSPDAFKQLTNHE